MIGLDRAIGASLSLDEVLPRLLDGLLEVFPRAERGFVLLVDPQSGRLVLRAADKGRGGRRGAAAAQPVAHRHGRASRGGRSSRPTPPPTAGSTRSDSIVDCRIRSVMCVPVVRGDGGLLGVIHVDSRDVRDGFDQADLEVLAGIAGQAAQAIEQALAHDERVQPGAAQPRPRTGATACSRACCRRGRRSRRLRGLRFLRAGPHVGGDFFAYVPLADDRLAVVLADVSGKGVSAALLMAALSADVRYCLASDRDLRRAVARINESFLRGGWDDRFATLVVAVLDPRGMR